MIRRLYEHKGNLARLPFYRILPEHLNRASVKVVDTAGVVELYVVYWKYWRIGFDKDGRYLSKVYNSTNYYSRQVTEQYVEQYLDALYDILRVMDSVPSKRRKLVIRRHLKMLKQGRYENTH